MGGLTKAQRVCLILVSAGFGIAGALHFIKPDAYVRIMPPYLPWHRQLVAISGFFEILGGLGLLVSPVRRAAAWGLVALLIAVFPANIYMATNPIAAGAGDVPSLLLWGRVPLQFFLVWFVLWCSRPHGTV
jgi:uncharacterized membrane protein